MQTPLDGALGSIELAHHYGDRLVLHVVRLERAAIAGLQMLEGNMDQAPLLLIEQILERAQLPIVGNPAHLLVAAGSQGADAHLAIERHAPGHAPQPAGEAIGVAELPELADQVQEDVLNEVLRIAEAAHNRQGNGEDSGAEDLEQRPDGIAVAALGKPDQVDNLAVVAPRLVELAHGSSS